MTADIYGKAVLLQQQMVDAYTLSSSLKDGYNIGVLYDNSDRAPHKCVLTKRLRERIQACIEEEFEILKQEFNNL